MAVKSELIAYDRSEKEIEQEIGADWLVYQNLDDLVKAATPTSERGKGRKYDCSVFNGEYVTGDIDDLYFERLKASRSDSSKDDDGKNDSSRCIDLHGTT